MENENYCTIQGWLINVLGLKGNELILFAIIYGFSQDGKSKYYGSLSYIQKSLKVSRPTAVKLIRSLIDKKIIKRASESHYEAVKKLYQQKIGSKETLLVGSKETLPLPSKETLPNKYNTNNNTNNKKRTPAQEMNFFLIDLEEPKRIATAISEKSNFSYEQVLSELRNFAGYWSELTKSGKKQRWQLQKTFELRRRLGTWFKNKDKFNNKKAKQLWNI